MTHVWPSSDHSWASNCQRGLTSLTLKTEERGQTNLTWKQLQWRQDLTHMATLTTQTETYTTHAILPAKVKNELWKDMRRNMQWEMASSKSRRDLGINNRTSSWDLHNGQRIYCSSLHVTNLMRTVRFVSKCGRLLQTAIFLWTNIWNDNYDRRSLKTEQVGETVEVQDQGLTNLWHTERSLHAALTAVPIFFHFFCPTSISILRTTCVCVTAYRLYMNYRYCQIIWYGEWNILTQIGSGAKSWLDVYHWGAVLAVNWRIRHIGQNVL